MMSFFFSVIFLVGLILFCLSGFFGWLFSCALWGYPWSGFGFVFLVDGLSFSFSYMLFCCAAVAFFYVFHYFDSDLNSFRLFSLMFLFVSVMLFLVFSGSLIFSLVMWDYLGLVSFFLILFYSNMVSLRASFITLFVSRLGDVSLFVIIMSCCQLWDGSVFFLIVSLLLVVLTKSACYPLISWLIEAMRAPTPVSSLVHSSTLVAAGVWFLLRYSYLFDDFVCSVLLFFSLLTIIVSGCCACVFMDLKKIVALSTCSNISWCVLFFVCGDSDLCLLQLLTHGLCKCYLFMSVGDLMSCSGGSQSAVGCYLSRYGGFFGSVVRGVLILSLCGLPFLGVFFSKHVLFSGVVYSYGFLFLIFLFFGFVLTYVYSFRFMAMLMGLSGGLSQGYMGNFVLVGFLFFLGSLVNFAGSVVCVESVAMSCLWSGFVLTLQILGAVSGLLLCWVRYDFLNHSFLVAGSYLFGGDCLVLYFYRSVLKFCFMSVLVCYRWEASLLSWFSLDGGLFYSLCRLVFSVGFLMCGLVSVAVFIFILS